MLPENVRRFIDRHARALDVARYQYHFENSGRETDGGWAIHWSWQDYPGLGRSAGIGGGK